MVRITLGAAAWHEPVLSVYRHFFVDAPKPGVIAKLSKFPASVKLGFGGQSLVQGGLDISVFAESCIPVYCGIYKEQTNNGVMLGNARYLNHYTISICR